MAIIEVSDRCPRCGAKVLETDYACSRCAQVLTWKKKPDEEVTPDGDKK